MKRLLSFLLLTGLLLPLFCACASSLRTETATAAAEMTAAGEEPGETEGSGRAPRTSSQKRVFDMTEYPLSDVASRITLLGERTNVTDEGLILEWACSGFEMEIATEGTNVDLHFNASYFTFFKVYVDGVENKSRITVSGKTTKTAVQDLPAGTHVIRVLKDGQPDKNGGACTLTSVSFEGELRDHVLEKKPLYLEFIGDSIWTGVGALGNQGSSPDYGSEISATVATPYRTVTALDADYNVTARGSIGVIKDAGGLVASQLFARLNGYRDEVPYEPTRSPDAVIICLGANDPGSGAEEFVQQGKALNEQIRALYGADTRIVWTNGMFNKTRFVNEIHRIVDESGGEAAGIYYLQMIYGQNGSGSGENNRHPSSSDHEKNAAVLIPFLQEILHIN